MADRPTFRSAVLPVLGVAAASACILSGCSSPLLAPDQERSQYDRYDAVRSQYASQYKEDEFGARKPNLRARLLPKE